MVIDLCKLDKKNGLKRIDPCIKELIENIQNNLCEEECAIVACCCGHKKYPMTVIVREEIYINGTHTGFTIRDWCSNIIIPRIRRFYKKDKQGYYYIPEVK